MDTAGVYSNLKHSLTVFWRVPTVVSWNLSSSCFHMSAAAWLRQIFLMMSGSMISMTKFRPHVLPSSHFSLALTFASLVSGYPSLRRVRLGDLTRTGTRAVSL